MLLENTIKKKKPRAAVLPYSDNVKIKLPKVLGKRDSKGACPFGGIVRAEPY